MERRIQQADRDRTVFHDLVYFVEVLALHRQDFLQRFFALFLRIGQNHAAYRGDTVFHKEHVLGTAQSDSLGAKLYGLFGIARIVGIGAYFQRTDIIYPAHKGAESAG